MPTDRQFPADQRLRRAKLALRICASGGLLILALVMVDPVAIIRHLTQIPLWSVVAAVALHVAIVSLIGWRWHGILRLHNPAFGLRRAVGISFVGAFFNQLLPTSMGGDVVRVWAARDDDLPMPAAVSSVVVDRIVGFLGLILFVFAAVLVAGSRFNAPAVSAFLLALAPLTLVAAFVLSVPRLPGRLGRLRARFGGDRLARDLGGLWACRGVLIRLLVLAAAGQLVAGLIGFCLAAGLGIGLSLGDAMLVFPAMVLATMIPISLAGWGVREGAAVFLLGLVGVAPAAAIAVSILFGATQVIAAIPGMFIWAAGARRPVPKARAWQS